MLASAVPLTPEQNEAGRRSGCTTQARDSKETQLAQLLNMKDVMYRDSINMELSPFERASAVRAHDVLAERIRIVRGRIKPGSRNVSIREESPFQSQRQLPAPRSRSSDYLADARATLAQAEAITKSTEAP